MNLDRLAEAINDPSVLLAMTPQQVAETFGLKVDDKTLTRIAALGEGLLLRQALSGMIGLQLKLTELLCRVQKRCRACSDDKPCANCVADGLVMSEVMEHTIKTFAFVAIGHAQGSVAGAECERRAQAGEAH